MMSLHMMDIYSYILPQLYFYSYTFLRLATGIFAVLIYFYLSGRTQLAQMNSLDVIANFIFGGVIGGAIYTAQGSYFHYLFMLIMAMVIFLAINMANRKSYILRTLSVGHAIPIIKDGSFLINNIFKNPNKVDLINVTSQLNNMGLHFDEIYFAQIEPNGNVTAISDRDKLPATVVINKGRFYQESIENSDLTEEKIMKDLKRFRIKDIDEVYLGEYKNGAFKYILNSGKVLPKSFEKKNTVKMQAERIAIRRAAVRRFKKKSQ